MSSDNNIESSALQKLASKLKNSRVLTDEESLFFAGIDHTRYSFTPSALIKIYQDSDVGEVLKIANEFGVKVTVRGAGTGCAGGALPHKGGWVIDLSGLDGIEIQPQTQLAKVGAGAITANVDMAAAKHALFYPPDPSSHKYCSIGGNIACNAGGLRAAKYGVTRDYVMALEGFLPTGEFVKFSRPLKKFSAGLNLKDLWISSEGILGVITSAYLKLIRRPSEFKTYLFFYDSEKSALQNVLEILAAGVSPSITEFMDAQTVYAARSYCKDVGIKEGMSVLLVQLDNANQDLPTQEKILLDSSSGKVVAMQKASNEIEAENLWQIRRKCSQSMYAIADSKLSQDIVLPLDKASEFFEFFKALGARLNVPTPTFGHALDGNYHIHAMYGGEDPAQTKNARELMDKSILKAIELGGAVSGEHGIGILKTRYMSYQHSIAELDSMRKIKKTLDPQDILNSGKILEDFDISKHKPLKNIKLPWD